MIKEQNPKEMAIDNPTKKKSNCKLSKTQLKMALVAKRLSMLQDDDDDEIKPLAAENPSQYDMGTENTNKIAESNGKDVLCESDGAIKSSTPEKKISGSTKRTRDIVSDESESEDVVLKTYVKRKKLGRVVTSDDESMDDGRELVEFVEPREKKRTELREVVNDGSLELEDFKVSVHPKKRRTERRDPSSISSRNTVSSPAMKRAQDIQASLSAEFPSFVKLMLRSHVIQGFWLGLPRKFCDRHLPKSDSIIMLVDEDGKEWKTKYLAPKGGLSGGWREFAIKRALREGDVVVYHLINPTTFKLYIVRNDNLGEVDGALGLLNLDAPPRQWISDDVDKTEESPVLLEENNQGSSGSDVELGFEVVDGIRFSDSDSTLTFEQTNTFEGFHIVVDGLVLDSKFCEAKRRKYYDLCLNQGVFLHARLLKGLNSSLVVGIIMETVNIADAVMAAAKWKKEASRMKTSFKEDVKVWERTLEGFRVFGMDVGFLCEQIRVLLGGGEENRVGLGRATETARDLESKIEELKLMAGRIGDELEAEMLQASNRRY